MVKHAFVSLGLSLALVCGCATQPKNGEPSDEPVEERADAPIEGITDTGAHVTCRTEKHTGSRIPRRICRTP